MLYTIEELILVPLSKILPITLRHEGGYVNNPNDPGGATNKGITQLTYNNYLKSKGLPITPVKDILDSEVDIIYNSIWNSCCSALFDDTHSLLAAYHFDTAVNCGNRQAALLLQRSVNTLDDGKIGPKTLARIKQTSELAALNQYLDKRIALYYAIVKHRPASQEFLKGWLIRAKSLYKELCQTSEVIKAT